MAAEHKQGFDLIKLNLLQSVPSYTQEIYDAHWQNGTSCNDPFWHTGDWCDKGVKNEPSNYSQQYSVIWNLLHNRLEIWMLNTNWRKAILVLHDNSNDILKKNNSKTLILNDLFAAYGKCKGTCLTSCHVFDDEKCIFNTDFNNAYYWRYFDLYYWK